MDHRVVKIDYRAIVLAAVASGDFDVAGDRPRRRRGRSSMSAHRRVPPGEPARSVNRSAPPPSPISARPRTRPSAAARAHGKSRPGERALHARRSRSSGSRGPRPPSLKMPSQCRRRSTATWSSPRTSLITERRGNMDLDAAINMLVSQNLDLMAAKLEIPMAEADVLTANLRANPIFYADTQLIPYGHFSFLRPGGPPQSDVNINYPLDISFKRAARTAFGTRGQERDRGPASRRGPQPDRQPLHGLRGGRRRRPDPKFSEVYLVGNQAAADRHRRALPERPDPGVRPASGQGQRLQGRAPGQGIAEGQDQGESSPRARS